MQEVIFDIKFFNALKVHFLAEILYVYLKNIVIVRCSLCVV